ncbi:hypothetical protein QSV34_00335 [Porticoccus sp. W117]|uniref:hypothetical protein n=1 Tax=Porticoccus sp. W117 TaxID=3054777 RepID=UPI002591421B|nr:hypothetical protein [Porticoccus sp. W117]MDM3869789.1 hypothetical protein [Porticoccus sp. W117]
MSFAIRGSDYRSQLELLPQELALYNKELKDQAVEQVWLLGDQLHNIIPADLTWFCYQVGSQLHDNAKDAIYGFEIDHKYISADGLALLHGLHFRRLKIRFGHSPALDEGGWMQQVDQTISLLDNAGFSDLICQVNVAEFACPDALNRLLLSLQLYNPQHIEIAGIGKTSTESTPPDIRKIYLNLLKRAQQRGYQVLGNQVLVAPGSRLQQLQQHHQLHFAPWGYSSSQLKRWLALGLAAEGSTGDLFYRNCSKLDCYRNRLGEGVYPHHWHGQLPEQQAGTENIVQSLLCYGELNNQQLAQLPEHNRKQISALINHACDRLWLEPNQKCWQLTTSGRIELRQLLSGLQQVHH